jgi:methylated-DNA-[protein]-cysteine S-methyltransferase
MFNLYLDDISSPMGDMMILTDDNGILRALEWRDLKGRMDTLLARQYRGIDLEISHKPAPKAIAQAIGDYFAGNIRALDHIETASGGTDFQRTVWGALRTIPVGQTRSYQDIASMIGNPKAVRAVGLANGANPIGIVVPCHRVIGANGALTGYGGGMARKQWLLTHEGALAKPLV